MFSQKWRTDTEKNEDENFQHLVYLVYDLQNSAIETSVFSEYENIIFIWKYLSEGGNLMRSFWYTTQKQCSCVK